MDDLKFVNELVKDQYGVKILIHLDSIEIKPTKNKPMLSMKGHDRTGEVVLKKWDFTDEKAPFEEGDCLKITGDTDDWNGGLDVVVKHAHLMEMSDEVYEHIYQPPRIDPDVLWKEFEVIVSLVQRPEFDIVKHIVHQNDEAIRNSPAALMYHHNWRHGLLYHIVSVCRLGQKASAHYNELYGEGTVDTSLVLAGCLLHDIAKIHDFTDDGESTAHCEAIGHIPMGIKMIEEARIAEGVPESPRIKHLLHIVSSHHGSKHAGSPVVPKTIDALLVLEIDSMDSIVEMAYVALLSEQNVVVTQWKRGPRRSFWRWNYVD